MSQKWFNNIDLQQNELQNGVIQNLAGDPSNGKAGQIYYNTTDKGIDITMALRGWASQQKP